MNIGLLVNDIKTEKDDFTTVDIALKAKRMGHNVYYMGIGDLAYQPEGCVSASAIQVKDKKYKGTETLLREVQSEKERDMITSNDLDVLLLRSDPAEDMETRGWAASAGLIFGQAAVKDGILVLNDPDSLANAINKMYFEHFPARVRPRTIISRDLNEIEDFFKKLKDHMVLKPLQGSGGKNVFFVKKDEAHNLPSIVEAITKNGYVVAQEYLHEAEKGDVRVFVMNGRILKSNNKYALVRRQNKKNFRSNVSAGGSVKEASLTDEITNIVDIVRPKLIQDGMFLVGLDVVGDKLMEVNVFSPGALMQLNKLIKADFTKEVIKSIEQKVKYKEIYGYQLSNKTLAGIQT